MTAIGEDATETDDPGTRDESTTPRLGPGSIFAGRYEVRRSLGEGGMGSVYEALDNQLGERVALKVLLMPRGNTAALERFRREVRVARRVTHRNAARTFDIGEAEGVHFLTMELVEGESLADLLLREGPLPPATVASIGAQICEGLAAVHEAGIVHRDLKPANVLISSSGRVVLTDFGIARPMNDDDGITRDGASMVGTPHYMAPEQVAGEAITERTDLYALGVVLYEMATGRRPFERDSVIATAVARLHGDPEPPTRHRSLPAELSATIMACLQREPSRRPADAKAVAARLVDTASTEPSGAGVEALATSQTIMAPAVTRPSTHATPRTTGGLSSATGFASYDVGTRSLAVLPLRYRGPKDDAYLAEALTEQLIDLLSMTRGLKVPAAAATAGFVDQRDPRAVRDALGVDTVVDGTMQRAGSRLRVVVRLLDAETGYQTWTEQFDGELEDVFELQDHIATRVAETLRLQLESRTYQYRASTEAIELYMRARVQMRSFNLGGPGPDGAVGLLERCLALAPDFPPAVASFALVAARMWFFWGGHDPDHDWEALCVQTVNRARELGPELPDTHLAAARMHTQRGQFAESARALQQALDLAPTHAAAHSYLGIMQCEAGRAKEGLRHIALAVELEPTEISSLITVARHHLLHGDDEAFEAILQRLWDNDPETRLPLLLTRMRAGSWRRNFAEVARWRDAIVALGRPGPSFPVTLAGYVLGEVELPELLEALDRTAPAQGSPRYRALMEQLTTEAMLARGEVEGALERLAALADGVLVDVDWVDHCPLFDVLQGRPELNQIKTKVRARAQAIWAIR